VESADIVPMTLEVYLCKFLLRSIRAKKQEFLDVLYQNYSQPNVITAIGVHSAIGHGKTAFASIILYHNEA
jgi:hypothetical protein